MSYVGVCLEWSGSGSSLFTECLWRHLGTSGVGREQHHEEVCRDCQANGEEHGFHGKGKKGSSTSQLFQRIL